jgi:hypothetical protein
VRKPVDEIVRYSPLEITTSVDMVTVPDTVQVEVELSHEAPKP